MGQVKTVMVAALFAAMFPAICAGSEAGPKPQPSAALYDELVAKAQSGDTDIDYTALRLSYAQTKDYDPYSAGTQTLFEDTWHAIQNKDCATVMAKSDELLKKDFTRIPIHAMRQDCYEQAGDTANAARELAIGRGLSQSLLDSGDGKSVDSAYVVVTLNEEGFVMSYLGTHEEQQALLQGKNGPVDLLQGTLKDGSKIGVYFDVANLFAGMSRQFSNPQ